MTTTDPHDNKTIAIETPSEDGETTTTFIAQWPTTGARGGKRLRANQHRDEPDTFVVFGKDRSCTPSGSWFQLMRFALDILSAENTHRVTEHCLEVPGYISINSENIPPILRQSRADGSEYGSTGKPYSFTETRDNETVTLNGKLTEYAIGPDEETIWMEKSTGSVDKFLSAARFRASWWEMMCFAVNILCSPNTKQLTEDVADFPERIYVDTSKYDVSMMTASDPPYRFRKGVPGNDYVGEDWDTDF